MIKVELTKGESNALDTMMEDTGTDKYMGLGEWEAIIGGLQSAGMDGRSAASVAHLIGLRAYNLDNDNFK